VDEERFNLELRKFLKRFGITAQREIEKGVLAALEAHTLADDAILSVYATLTIPGVVSELRIEGQIALSGPASA
jgi:Family of unknown function (DUF6494)